MSEEMKRTKNGSKISILERTRIQSAKSGPEQQQPCVMTADLVYANKPYKK
jgi:hypothetical protein